MAKARKQATRKPAGKKTATRKPASTKKASRDITSGKHKGYVVLEWGDVERMIRACSTRTITGLRNRALLSVMYCTGARLAEVLDFHPKDLRFDKGTAYIREARKKRGQNKGQPRSSGLLPDAEPYVAAWVAKRAELGLNGRHRLFSTISTRASGETTLKPGGQREHRGKRVSLCTEPGKPLHPSVVLRLVAKLGRKAGIESGQDASGEPRPVHPHAFRHGCAYRLAQLGLRPEQIRDWLGHSSVQTTNTYLRRLGETELGGIALSLQGRVFSDQEPPKASAPQDNDQTGTIGRMVAALVEQGVDPDAIGRAVAEALEKATLIISCFFLAIPIRAG